MESARANRVVGSLLALALGDAFGAPHEGGFLERALWALIGVRNGKRRWTDDTQMTVDTVESLVERGRVDPDDLARRFAASYRWSRGYGPGTARVLKRIRRGQPWEAAARAVFREGSHGNGGAMRSPAVGLFLAAEGEEAIAAAASQAAAVTHAHPLAQEGAVLLALATALALSDVSPAGILERLSPWAKSPGYATRLGKAREWLAESHAVPSRSVASELGNGNAAVGSCVTSIYLALRSIDRPFEDLLGLAIQLGGDVDTIAAMAAAIWGATRGLGELPGAWLERLEGRERLMEVAGSLAAAVRDRRAIH